MMEVVAYVDTVIAFIVEDLIDVQTTAPRPVIAGDEFNAIAATGKEVTVVTRARHHDVFGRPYFIANPADRLEIIVLKKHVIVAALPLLDAELQALVTDNGNHRQQRQRDHHFDQGKSLSAVKFHVATGLQ